MVAKLIIAHKRLLLLSLSHSCAPAAPSAPALPKDTYDPAMVLGYYTTAMLGVVAVAEAAEDQSVQNQRVRPRRRKRRPNR